MPPDSAGRQHARLRIFLGVRGHPVRVGPPLAIDHFETIRSLPLSSLKEWKAALASDLRRTICILGGALAVLWLVLLANAVFFDGQLARFGIVPRTVDGLRGIAFAPFLHAGITHLVANTVGLLIFGGLVLLRNETDFWLVTLIGALVGGFGTWLFGRPLIHIGASGVIFAYFGYLLSTGIFERRLGAILLSLLAVFGWGGLIYGVLPGQPGVSWESHLFGVVGGACAAWLIARKRRRPASSV
jgi:membrane associated rhomboid family serine protease